MNNENLYLIHEETYVAHINEKVQLYSMLKQLAHMVKHLPANRGSKDLTKLAAVMEKRSDEMYKSWNIPGSYLLFGDEADLTYLMNEELCPPEMAGYVICNGDCDECCPCGEDCPCCEIGEEDAEIDELDKSGDDENESDIGELFAMLGEVMHSIFGDSVTVHVFSE